MKRMTKSDIVNMDRIKRLTLINAITGIKPANLIGTTSKSGQTNCAIFSSVVHLGSNPAVIGMISRPSKIVRHTLQNIMETGFYTINHISESLVERAHYTSAKFPKEESEFDACQIEPFYLDDFMAPFVQESPIKIGLKFVEQIAIEFNKTILIVGEVEHLLMHDEVFESSGDINLEKINTVGISGLDSYYKLQKIAQFPYARIKDIPDFNQA